MDDLRPRNMSQQEFADMLRENGFTACSKAAVSLAERSKESGVQFTPEARKIARRALNSTVEHGALVCAATGQDANRKNPNKTTVWLDDDTRVWLEDRAYMEDSSVGAVIRAILAEARTRGTEKRILRSAQNDGNKKAVSGAGTSETAQMEGNMAFPLLSENITKTEENQV